MMEETMQASPNTVHCQEIPRFQREIHSPNLQLPKTFDSTFFIKPTLVAICLADFISFRHTICLLLHSFPSSRQK